MKRAYKTYDPAHTQRLMILGGMAILIATPIYFLWLRDISINITLIKTHEFNAKGWTSFGLATLTIFDLLVFAFESMRSQRK